eukprot:CAMPEP_0174264694 /NCGR_PEP_ID=MMETSP0439-20130205/23471_1 /TAXON_ID=0 /ORGANISM="Stereomyxa ramosa, Strain Chinc5" /LENGTH=664 /DNA_ID=CAMNT_0015350713 /DNA_START=249 /DNA_END=2240 /DNA_ORIENTATION=+
MRSIEDDDSCLNSSTLENIVRQIHYWMAKIQCLKACEKDTSTKLSNEPYLEDIGHYLLQCEEQELGERSEKKMKGMTCSPPRKRRKKERGMEGEIQSYTPSQEDFQVFDELVEQRFQGNSEWFEHAMLSYLLKQNYSYQREDMLKKIQTVFRERLDFFSLLPYELSVIILSKLAFRDVLNVACVNKQCNTIANDCVLWKNLCLGMKISQITHPEFISKLLGHNRVEDKAWYWKIVFLHHMAFTEIWQKGHLQRINTFSSMGAIYRRDFVAIKNNLFVMWDGWTYIDICDSKTQTLKKRIKFGKGVASRARYASLAVGKYLTALKDTESDCIHVYCNFQEGLVLVDLKEILHYPAKFYEQERMWQQRVQEYNQKMKELYGDHQKLNLLTVPELKQLMQSDFGHVTRSSQKHVIIKELMDFYKFIGGHIIDNKKCQILSIHFLENERVIVIVMTWMSRVAVQGPCKFKKVWRVVEYDIEEQTIVRDIQDFMEQLAENHQVGTVDDILEINFQPQWNYVVLKLADGACAKLFLIDYSTFKVSHTFTAPAASLLRLGKLQIVVLAENELSGYTVPRLMKNVVLTTQLEWRFYTINIYNLVSGMSYTRDFQACGLHDIILGEKVGDFYVISHKPKTDSTTSVALEVWKLALLPLSLASRFSPPPSLLDK